MDKSSDIITFGCGKEYPIYRSNLQYLSCGRSNLEVVSIGHLTKTNMVYYLNSGGSCVEVPLDESRNQQMLFANQKSCDPSKIAVSNKYLAISNAGAPLLVYRFPFTNNQSTSHMLHGRWLWSLKFHPDGDLVTMDYAGTVSKYRIGDEEMPELIWHCATFKGAYALCVDQNTGLVYVTAPDHMLYIISAGMSSC